MSLDREGGVCPDYTGCKKPAELESIVDGYLQTFLQHNVNAANTLDANG